MGINYWSDRPIVIMLSKPTATKKWWPILRSFCANFEWKSQNLWCLNTIMSFWDYLIIFRRTWCNFFWKFPKMASKLIWSSIAVFVKIHKFFRLDHRSKFLISQPPPKKKTTFGLFSPFIRDENIHPSKNSANQKNSNTMGCSHASQGAHRSPSSFKCD